MSEDEFGAFFAANVDRAHRLAWRLLGGDDGAAEDIVQDAFAKAYRNRGGFRGDSSLETWFYRIVVRTAQNQNRGTGLRLRLRALEAGPEEQATGEPSRDSVLTRRLNGAVAGLPRNSRDAFVLVHLEGFSVRDSAVLLRKAEGTVKSHLHRALKRLRRELGDLRPGESTHDHEAWECRPPESDESVVDAIREAYRPDPLIPLRRARIRARVRAQVSGAEPALAKRGGSGLLPAAAALAFVLVGVFVLFAQLRTQDASAPIAGSPARDALLIDEPLQERAGRSANPGAPGEGANGPCAGDAVVLCPAATDLPSSMKCLMEKRDQVSDACRQRLPQARPSRFLGRNPGE